MPKFLTIFPNAENVHLIKDVGMIPYTLHREYGYDSTIASYKNGVYPYYETEVKGITQVFISKKFNNEILNVCWFILMNFRKYDKSFTHIVLPANVLSSLSGGTEHNPDHLCTIKSCSILVDSKSSNSIHGEIHKVIAYNIYAKEAHTKAFIFLDDTLPNKSISIFQKLILETHENLENIILFTKSALENLSKNDSVKTHFENLFSANKFTLVCSNLDKNFKLLEQSFPDNLY